MTKLVHRLRKRQGGFTLIELLIVIAIFGILASFIVANMAESRAQARDAERLNDLKQIQVALELYYNRNKEYPTALTNLGTYIEEQPADPISGRAGTADDYQYQANGQQYGLAALSDDESTWCTLGSAGATFFSSYQDCPFY